MAFVEEFDGGASGSSIDTTNTEFDFVLGSPRFLSDPQGSGQVMAPPAVATDDVSNARGEISAAGAYTDVTVTLSIPEWDMTSSEPDGTILYLIDVLYLPYGGASIGITVQSTGGGLVMLETYINSEGFFYDGPNLLAGTYPTFRVEQTETYRKFTIDNLQPFSVYNLTHTDTPSLVLDEFQVNAKEVDSGGEQVRVLPSRIEWNTVPVEELPGGWTVGIAF